MPASRASAPVASCNHTEMLALSRMPRCSAVARLATSAMVDASASSRENSSAFALSASRRCASYRVRSRGDGCVAGQDLEQPKIVRVELIEAELRDHDDAGDARPVPERHREERLLDLGGTLDLLAELVLRGVADQQGRAGLGHATRDAAADPRRQELRGSPVSAPVRSPRTRRARDRRGHGETRGSCGSRSGVGARRRW